MSRMRELRERVVLALEQQRELLVLGVRGGDAQPLQREVIAARLVVDPVDLAGTTASEHSLRQVALGDQLIGPGRQRDSRTLRRLSGLRNPDYAATCPLTAAMDLDSNAGRWATVGARATRSAGAPAARMAVPAPTRPRSSSAHHTPQIGANRTVLTVAFTSAACKTGRPAGAGSAKRGCPQEPAVCRQAQARAG